MRKGIEASADAVRLRTLGHLALEGPGAGLGTVLRQPKTLAVLVFLLITSRDGCVRRDRIVAMFWPELDHNRARAALRNALYHLRRALPDDTIVSEGDEMLRVDHTRIWIDVLEFEEATDRGALESALGVYRGDFMPAFHLNGASEFGAWRDAQERRYRRAALSAATTLAAHAEAEGRAAEALHWLEKAVALAPYDEEPIRRLIASLLSRGDRGAARAAYQAHVVRLRHLELAPSAETTALMADEAGPEDDHGTVRDAAAAAPVVGVRGRGEVPSTRPGASAQIVGPWRHARTGFFAAAVASVVAIGVGRPYFESQRAWTEGFSDFRAHVASGNVFAAYDRGRSLRAWLGGDQEFEALWQQVTAPATVRTSPGNATISVQDYGSPGGPWVTLGDTPLHDVSLPATYLRWRIERPGYEPVERAGFDLAFRREITFRLPDGEVPPGMAYVSGDAVNPGAPQRMRLDPFWLDRTEVSNSEYGKFVREGGYRGLHLASGESRAVQSPVLVDRSGLPGPATWVHGTWPLGEGDHPVRGVSWFEADAYCAWAGKELPTAYHWFAAGGYAGYSDILLRSNFSHAGPTPVGEAAAIGPYGHHDLAGNVREWAANEREGRRVVLGGAWDTPSYQFMTVDAADPTDRSDHNGFRCARVPEDADHPSRSPLSSRERRVERVPAAGVALSDQIAHFDYDSTPLRASTDSVSEVHPVWRKEFVTFDAAYGGERMGAVIFVPRHGSPPFAPVVFHPGADAGLLPSSAAARTSWFDFLARDNYAVVYPVYKGTYERRAPTSGPIGVRDRLIERVKDLRRALDYIETRDDIDLARVTYYGFSEGAILAPLVTAVETRIDAAVLLSGGLGRGRLDDVVEPRNFLRHARKPLLMIGGELDFLFPFEATQRPFFEAWGAPRREKRLVAMPFGHTPRDMRPVAEEILGWLRGQSGSVATAQAGG